MQSFFRIYIVLSVLLMMPCAAQAEQTVNINITVSAEADNAENAKRAAVEDGERKAFYLALAEVAPDEARDIFRAMRERDLTKFLQSFTITRKVITGGKFDGDITYRFDESQIIGLTSAGNKASAQEEKAYEGAGLLVIPPYDSGEELLLFERMNLWRAIVNSVSLDIGRGALVMPFGDPSDIALLDDETVLRAERSALESAARRYGTKHVVVALATQGVNDLGFPMITVDLRKAGSSDDDVVTFAYEAESPVETLDMVIQRAAHDIVTKLENSIDEYGLFADEEDAVAPIIIRSEYAFGEQWRRMLAILESLPDVARMDIGAITVNFSEAVLYTSQSHDMVKRMLETRGLRVDTSRPYWVVTLEQ